MLRVLLVFGTRPEAIKMAPVYLELKKRSAEFSVDVCVTAQHRSMLDQVLDLFSIRPTFDLNIMRPNQSLTEITAGILTEMPAVIERSRPDWMLVHGDTTTTLAASLAGFYGRCRVAHVEAGLRTSDKLAPWPEELNRRITSAIADLHFAPTERAKNNLLQERIDEQTVFVTGNTVIDALHQTIAKIEDDQILQESLERGFPFLQEPERMILVTAHRRESFGEGFEGICLGLRRILLAFPNFRVVYPVHRNPNVREPVFRILGEFANSVGGRLTLIDPLEYLPFVFLMSKAHLIITDSGGVQEEAPGLGKPVLVLRDVTERPEAVDAGTVRLVGTNPDTIFDETAKLLASDEEYSIMARAHNPYGDGHASKRIADRLIST